MIEGLRGLDAAAAAHMLVQCDSSCRRVANAHASPTLLSQIICTPDPDTRSLYLLGMRLRLSRVTQIAAAGADARFADAVIWTVARAFDADLKRWSVRGC